MAQKIINGCDFCQPSIKMPGWLIFKPILKPGQAGLGYALEFFKKFIGLRSATEA
jgi:hypothetical protein